MAMENFAKLLCCAKVLSAVPASASRDLLPKHAEPEQRKAEQACALGGSQGMRPQLAD